MTNTLVGEIDAEQLIEADLAFTPGQLDAAAAIVRRLCRWHVAPSVTETVVLDGDGSTELALPSMHVTDVSAVTVLGREITDFEWSTNGLLERTWACWPRRKRAVTVEFTHGHAETPEDLTAAVVAVAQSLPAVVGGEGIEVGVVEEQIGSYRYRLSTGESGPIDPSLLLMLGPYRLPQVP